MNALPGGQVAPLSVVCQDHRGTTGIRDAHEVDRRWPELEQAAALHAHHGAGEGTGPCDGASALRRQIIELNQTFVTLIKLLLRSTSLFILE